MARKVEIGIGFACCVIAMQNRRSGLHLNDRRRILLNMRWNLPAAAGN
jgi:hypothetical protein